MMILNRQSLLKYLLMLFLGILLTSLGLVTSVHAAKGWTEFKQGEKLRLAKKEKQDFVKAALFYKKSCEKGYGRACWRLGVLWESGLAFRTRIERIGYDKQALFDLYKKACDRNDGYGCVRLALFYEAGKRVQRSQRKAKTLCQKACRKRVGAGCYWLLKQMDDSFEKKSKQHPKKKLRRSKKELRQRQRLLTKTVRLLRKDCSQKIGQACYVLGYMLFKGQFLPVTRRKASLIFLKGCEFGHADSCDFSGILFGNALGVRKDFARAKTYHQKACRLLLADGCLHLGGMFFRGLGGQADLKKAQTSFKAACDGKNAQGCLLLGEMFIRGEGMDRDVKGAYHLFKKGCELKSKNACRRTKMMKRILGLK